MSCSFAFNGTTVFLFVSLNLLQRKDLRPQLTRARQSHPVLRFCFTLRCHSLYFAHAKLSFVQLRAASAFRSAPAYAKSASWILLHTSHPFTPFLLTQKVSFTLLRAASAFRSAPAYAKSATRSRTPLKKIKYLF